jgi:hypothetical protein
MQEVRAHKPPAIKTGRRKTAAALKKTRAATSGPKCAGDVLKLGETMGWV